MHELMRLKRHYNALLQRHKKAEQVESTADKEKFIKTYETLRSDLNETLEAIRDIEEVSADEVINGFKGV